MAYFLDNYPVLENSNALSLTQEQEEFCRVVYKLNENGDAYFSELWNPDKDYSDEYVVVRLKSTGGKFVYLEPKNIANVINSGGEPKPAGVNSWLKFWLDKTGTRGGVSQCSTDSYFYYSDGNEEKRYERILFPVEDSRGKNDDQEINAACCGLLVGAHIIYDKTEAAEVEEGGEVYIIPICEAHNKCHPIVPYGKPAMRWGTGYYMKLRGATKAVKLIGYLKKVGEYIEQLKKEGAASEK
ncbi:MAG: hypothetical protein J1F28_10145 [Oscillospiraceae bacterium]|nr:hypothetical protein [Oscillospiraceae bacterium]